MDRETIKDSMCLGLKVGAVYIAVRISIAVIITHPEILLYTAALAILAAYVRSVWHSRGVFAEYQARRDSADYHHHRYMAQHGIEPWKSGAQRWLNQHERTPNDQPTD